MRSHTKHGESFFTKLVKFCIIYKWVITQDWPISLGQGIAAADSEETQDGSDAALNGDS